MIRPAIVTTALLCATTAGAQTMEQRRVFVACPILRDVSPAPCWLASYGGELYYLGPQGSLAADFYPPQFNHKTLVEGVVTNERHCGGRVLTRVKASVLPEIDRNCNVMLPAEGYAERDGIRGTGPSGVRGGGETEARPPRPAPAPKPVEPYSTRTFTAPFDADTDRTWNAAQSAVTQAASYSRDINASLIRITGYRAAIRLSNGKDYIERAEVAESRARVIEEALVTVGLLAGTRVQVKWESKPTPSTGTMKDADNRRALIEVIP